MASVGLNQPPRKNKKNTKDIWLWLKNMYTKWNPSDTQWPLEEKGTLFSLVEFQDEPLPQKKEKRAPPGHCDILWMDEILHHLKIPGGMLPL